MTPPRTFHVPGRTVAVLAIGVLLAAVAVLFLSAGASATSGAMSVNGWTYRPHTGILTASADAWNRNDAPGTVIAKVWRWDLGQHKVIREKSWDENTRPVRIELGRQPYNAAVCQWDVVLIQYLDEGVTRRTWLAGKKWACNPAPTSTTTTTSPPTTTTTSTSPTTTEPTNSTTTQPTTSTTTAPTTSTTTEPTWTTTTTPPPSSTTTTTQPPSSTTTTSQPTTSTSSSSVTPPTSTSSTATSSSQPTGKTSSTSEGNTSWPPSTPPTQSSEPTPLPSTGNAWTWPVTLGGLLALALGVLITAASGRKTGKYRR